MPTEEARKRIVGHAAVLATDQPGKVRVRLVAEDFPPSVTATVLFLRELGSGGPESAKLDIGYKANGLRTPRRLAHRQRSATDPDTGNRGLLGAAAQASR